jgi:Protein of unknown function (DUF3108)
MEPADYKGALTVLILVGGFLSGSASAEDAGQHAIHIRANYGVYWAGLHLGDVRLAMTVDGSNYQMKGDGRFSILAGLLYEWHGGTSSAGNLAKGNPKLSLYTVSYAGGDKQSDLRISFSDGAVSQVLAREATEPPQHSSHKRAASGRARSNDRGLPSPPAQSSRG